MKPALYSILWLFLGSAALGQGTSSGVSALKIPTNALQATLGASTVSTAMSLGAVSMNPASVVTTEGTLSVLFTHTSWVEGTTGNHLSVSLPMPLGQAFLTTGMSVVPDIEVRTGPGPPSSTFSARTAQIGGGWGLEISSGILLGLSASYVYDRLYDTEATGLSGSAGVLATGLLDDATFGASVTNSGSVPASAASISPVFSLSSGSM